MKKYIKHLSFCLLAGVGLSSCDTDDNGYKEDPVDVGGYAYLQDRSITVLDQNETVSINLMSDDNVTFESVAIEDGDGNQIATATVSGETATFNTSSLGDFMFGDDNDEVTGSFPLTIVSTLSNGMVVRDNASISVGHAVHVSGPSEVQYMDGTESDDVVLEYSVEPFGATVDDFTLEYKIGSEGTYQVDQVNPVEGTEGTIDFADLDYEAYGLQPGDTIFYRWTATSGELTDQAMTSVAIVPQAFTDGASGTVYQDETMSELSLWTGDNYAAETGSGDIAFTGSAAAPGFTAVEGSDIMFAETSEEINSVLDARDAFENSLVTSDTVPLVESGDVVVYKVTREIENEDEEMETVTHYGYIEVGSVTIVDGETVSFEVDASEGQVAPAPQPAGEAAE